MMRLGIQKTTNVKKKKKIGNASLSIWGLSILPHGKLIYLFVKNVSFYLQKKQHWNQP